MFRPAAGHRLADYCRQRTPEYPPPGQWQPLPRPVHVYRPSAQPELKISPGPPPSQPPPSLFVPQPGVLLCSATSPAATYGADARVTPGATCPLAKGRYGQVSGGPPPHAARSDIQEPGSSSARPQTLPNPHVFFTKLRENLQRSCLRSFWIVPDETDAFVDQEKKKAFLAQVLRAPFSLDDSWKGQFLNHLRTLNPPAAKQFDISSQVLDHLAMAVCRSDLPYPQVFKTATSGEQTVSWIHFPSERGCQESFAQGFCCQQPGRHWTGLPATGHWFFSAGQQ